MSVDMQRILEALSFTPADDRVVWVKVGMAIKSELGESGFEMWKAWSQQAKSYRARAALDVWKSIRGGGKVTIGTLFHEAKTHGWRDDGSYQKPTPQELADRLLKETAWAEKDAWDEVKRHNAAATQAENIWKASLPAPDDYPYLIRKGIKANGARIHNGLLVIPIRDAAGRLWNVERISPNGKDKKGLYGGRRTGCFFSMGTVNGSEPICIAEGFATGASIREATGYNVVVAFNAGNLKSVAMEIRKMFPMQLLIICADDDSHTPGNPGLVSAAAAARAVNALIALPNFDEEAA